MVRGTGLGALGRVSSSPPPWTPARALALAATLSLAPLGLVLAAAGPAAAGVEFVQAASGEGLVFARAGDRDDPDPSFVEIMGGGACWLDFDGDGDQDLFLVNGWHNDSVLAEHRQPRSQLFRNDGPGPGPDFVDVTGTSGLEVRGWTQGCSAADYDADGFDDLLVVGHGIQWLWRNRGDGTFVNATAASGITADGKCPGAPCWGVSAAWADYDRDGCLDVYVITFVAFHLAAGGERSPLAHHGQPNQLWRNRCDGTFEDATAAAGADGGSGPHRGQDWGVTWLDYDLDGWLDIFIASDGVPDVLYRNNGDGTFTDQAPAAGIADPRNGMGVAAGDCEDDGDEDLFFTHYSGVEGTWVAWDGFYVNRGDGTFEDRSGEGDLALVYQHVRWGVGWEDFDNDGDLDLHVVAGSTENLPGTEQPHLFWLGDGACHYTDARATGGAALRTARMSRGSSYADWDLDGDVDAVVVNLMDQFTELHEARGAAGNWLVVELRQPGGNPKALGARVEVELPDGKVLHRRLNPGSSIHGNNAPQVHVGLGPHPDANVTVTWPQDQVRETFSGIGANQVARLHRGGHVQTDTLGPRTTLHVAATPGSPGAPGPVAWYTTPGTLHATAEDRAVGTPSGIARTELLLDHQPIPPGTPLPEGTHLVQYRSVDHAGNHEPWRHATLGLDTQPPHSTLTLTGTLHDGTYQGPLQATFTCTDPTSGPATIHWRIDEGPWQAYTTPLHLTRAGTHALTWHCTDAAGNAEPPRSHTFTQDPGHPHTQPHITATPGNHGWWRSRVLLRLASEGWPHEVASTQVALGDGPFETYTGTFRIAGDGVHVVRFRSIDAAGREEPLRTLVIPIDATPPALRLVEDGPHVETAQGLIVGPRHAVRAVVEEAGSGLEGFLSQRDWEPWRPALDVFTLHEEGPHGIALHAWDRAGNAARLDREVVLDTTPPALDVARPRNHTIQVGSTLELDQQMPGNWRAWLVGDAVLEAAVGPDVAGIARVRFLVDGLPAAEVREAPWAWAWSRPPDAARGFDHYVTFEVEDRVGNAAQLSFGVLATGHAPALLPPLALAAMVLAPLGARLTRRP